MMDARKSDNAAMASGARYFFMARRPWLDKVEGPALARRASFPVPFWDASGICQ